MSPILKAGMFQRNSLAIIMICLGLMKMMGLAFDSVPIRKLANTFAVSPAPSPFYRLHQNTSVLCSLSGNRMTEFAWDAATRGSISGPHRRHVTFLHMFALARSPAIGPWGEERVHSMIEFHFCKSGSWGAGRCGEAPQTITFEDRNTVSNSNKNFVHTCSL